MLVIMLVALSIGCLALTISAYEALRQSPKPLLWLAQMIESSAVVSFVFNMAISSLLTLFIGAGMVAGAANLLASVVFMFYVEARKRMSPLPSSTGRKARTSAVGRWGAEDDLEDWEREDRRQRRTRRKEVRIMAEEMRKDEERAVETKRAWDPEEVGEKAGAVVKGVVEGAKRALPQAVEAAKEGGRKGLEFLNRFVEGFKRGVRSGK